MSTEQVVEQVHVVRDSRRAQYREVVEAVAGGVEPAKVAEKLDDLLLRLRLVEGDFAQDLKFWQEREAYRVAYEQSHEEREHLRQRMSELDAEMADAERAKREAQERYDLAMRDREGARIRLLSLEGMRRKIARIEERCSRLFTPLAENDG